jgi:hypothetical protein
MYISHLRHFPGFRKVIYISFLFIYSSFVSFGQDVYYHVSNRELYDFLDELANNKLISLNSAIKPYSREFIALQLQIVSQNQESLTKRQKQELAFYLKDFNKELHIKKDFNKRFDLFYYSDSLFKISINPILGAQGWKNDNGTNYHRWYGAEAYAYIGKHIGFYASLRDNHEDKIISDTGFLNTRYGGVIKEGNDYSEMRGGITAKWKWGTFGMVKDHIEWGDNYHYPNIISSKAPSFAQIKLQLRPVKWFEFNYFHGWLVSGVIDSSRSYNYNGVQRNVFHSKYMAANMFTFIPLSGLNFSFGNSIVYSDIGVQPAYLIPVFFYKSVDHTYNNTTTAAGQNSQLFFNISCRLVPKVHMYYSMFLDELSFSRMFDPNQQSNHWSMKGGIRVSNLIPNLMLTCEYTRNNPFVYQNDNLTTLYTSNNYCMGHFLQDNSDVLYIAADFRPARGIHIKTWYEKIRKGPEYPYNRNNDPQTGIPGVWGKKFLETTEWEQSSYGLSIQYQVINDLYFFTEICKAQSSGKETLYLPAYFQNSPLTFSAGMNFGF